MAGVGEEEQVNDYCGVPEQTIGAGSNPASSLTAVTVGANPTAAAIYIDDATGA